MLCAHEHLGRSCLRVERRRVEHDHPLIVRTEESRGVERPDCCRALDVPHVHYQPSSVLACPAQGNVRELILPAQVAHQYLELFLQEGEVAGGVVCAAGRFRRGAQLRLLEHLPDTQRVQLDA